MRVVADTNVIVSGILWIGAPHTILIAAENARLTLSTSPALLQELEGVLKRPKFVPRLRDLQVTAEEVTAAYARLAHIVSPRRVMRLVAADPADDEVLACALAARAKFIITGDSDLLQLRSYTRISILSPAAFILQNLSKS